MSKIRGLTLIELLVALFLLAAIAVLTAPSFSRLFHTVSIHTESMRLLGALRAARVHAIRSHVRTVLCPGTDSSLCEGDYRDGWLLFTDTNQNGLYDQASDEFIRSFHAMPEGLQLTQGSGEAPFSASIIYRANGTVMRPATLRFCASSAQGVRSRRLVISLVGRVRTVKDSEGCLA